VAADIVADLEHMMGCLTAADASRRQVAEVLAWQQHVQSAVTAADAYTQSPVAYLRTPQPAQQVPESSVHRGWTAACAQIAGALSAEAAEAEQFWFRHIEEALAWEAAAAAAMARAAAAHAAAADADDAESAAAAEAEAAAAEAEAAAAEAMAQAHRRAAALAEAWHEAAAYASQFGAGIVAIENSIQLPVAEAVAAAGGSREVAQVKTFHQPAAGG
jgi:hypothetical protein